MLTWINTTGDKICLHLAEFDAITLAPGDHLTVDPADCDRNLLDWLASLEGRGVLRRVWLH